MKLYDLERSGNCYKIRLFLSVLGVGYEKIPIDANAGENQRPEFLALNPNGLLPVLVDDDMAIYDSAAILVYLAKRYGEPHWFPDDPISCARVVRWLAFEQSEGRFGLTRARSISLRNPTAFARSGTLAESQALAVLALQTLDRQLVTTTWLAGGDQPAICDIACYPYTAMSPEGGLSLDPYPGIGRWLEAIEQWQGYVPLPWQTRALRAGA